MFAVGLRLHSATAASSASAATVAARLGCRPRALPPAVSGSKGPDGAPICAEPFEGSAVPPSSATDVSAPPTPPTPQILPTPSIEVETRSYLDSDASLHVDRPLQFIDVPAKPQAKESRRARRRRKLAEANSGGPTILIQSDSRMGSSSGLVTFPHKVYSLNMRISSGVNSALGASRLRLPAMSSSKKAQAQPKDWVSGTSGAAQTSFYPTVAAACHSGDTLGRSSALDERGGGTASPGDLVPKHGLGTAEIGGQPEWSSACSDQSTPSTTTSSLAPAVVQASELKSAFVSAPPVLPPTAAPSPVTFYHTAESRPSDSHVMHHLTVHENGLNISGFLSPTASYGMVHPRIASDYKDISHPQCVYQNNAYQQHQQQFNSRLDHYRDVAYMSGLAQSYGGSFSHVDTQFVPQDHQCEQMNVWGQQGVTPGLWHDNYELNTSPHSHRTEFHLTDGGVKQQLLHSSTHLVASSDMNMNSVPRATKQSSFGSIGQKRGDCVAKPENGDTVERLAMFGWSLF
ncbi:hypothetical protein HDU82_005332 [Entophlyctis luteolus]|nr:hypothetical protein HDU82_005332 [Entophlyctis luteolus]